MYLAYLPWVVCYIEMLLGRWDHRARSGRQRSAIAFSRSWPPSLKVERFLVALFGLWLSGIFNLLVLIDRSPPKTDCWLAFAVPRCHPTTSHDPAVSRPSTPDHARREISIFELRPSPIYRIIHVPPSLLPFSDCFGPSNVRIRLSIFRRQGTGRFVLPSAE
ncbi:hypothetical protein B0H63DRAFT_290974 [Podospora didyma]|uniref:Uncharacterized protein n=1 Tax=Podospora didyma TaxID=330526 RepID=A0AAE0K8W9_9PEZI|nr:hypothetical protein B0H63DRAFT_290974 [Podospora didyma]